MSDHESSFNVHLITLKGRGVCSDVINSWLLLCRHRLGHVYKADRGMGVLLGIISLAVPAYLRVAARLGRSHPGPFARGWRHLGTRLSPPHHVIRQVHDRSQ